ncbi:MAG: pre-16S rRNA-processing nuclease YqgF [Armatimonadetes bacterium]|nr:pre-16S rRNA-processing nuclease YqgF [Armatimonadota bacterium]
MKRTVLAIDPGSGKCGLAVVRKEDGIEEILHRRISQIEELGEDIIDIAASYDIDLIVIGNGTNSKQVQSKIRAALPGQAMLILDERDTSIRARERYWQHTPRRGWRRLLPSSLQVPPVPVDDFVAVILAERALSAD